jgi:glycerol-3-phosphate dehydrogenase (NAD(P)+)
MYKRITIIGSGSMATVCALLLDSQGADVTMWLASSDRVADLSESRENRRYQPGYRIPTSIRITDDEATAMRNADLVVSAVPTQFMRGVWQRLTARVKSPVPIVSVAKGIEASTLLRPTQVIADVLSKNHLKGSDHPLATISGPSVADELARCLPATVCAASEDDSFTKELQKTFTTHWFRVYTHRDLLGVELAGATKNVIALAAGILDGLHAGYNAKSALLSRGLAEIARLGVAMGAQPQTFFGIAGVGDLATTCFSPTGRNRSCGEHLGKGRKLQDVLGSMPGVVEGVPTTKAVVELAKQHGVEMPITQAVNQVLFENLDPIEAISRLMSRELKPEKVC